MHEEKRNITQANRLYVHDGTRYIYIYIYIMYVVRTGRRRHACTVCHSLLHPFTYIAYIAYIPTAHQPHPPTTSLASRLSLFASGRLTMPSLPEELHHPLLQPHRPRNSRGLRADSTNQPQYESNIRNFYGQTTLVPPPNLARVRAGRTASPVPGLTSASSARPITETVVLDRHGKKKKRIRQDGIVAGTSVATTLGGPSGTSSLGSALEEPPAFGRRQSRDTEEDDTFDQTEPSHSIVQLSTVSGSPAVGRTVGTTREERLRRARVRAAAAEARGTTQGDESPELRTGGLVRGASMRRFNVQEGTDLT